jgi:hypothetical protein
MKIEVFLRHCFYSPNSSLPNRLRPEWFDKPKIFENFKKTINQEIANYTIVYDEHFGSINETFLSDEKNVEIINCGNEAGSFLKTLDIIQSKNFDDDTIIYFLEDDYLHRENWCEVLIEAFTLPIHYVSLYDHLDKYHYYDDLRSKIFYTPSVHWRTTPSTCNTYATKLNQLNEDIDVHRHFSAVSSNGISMDHDKFCRLGDMGRVLVTPIPGYSTHCDQFQSPTINWEKYI